LTLRITTVTIVELRWEDRWASPKDFALVIQPLAGGNASGSGSMKSSIGRDPCGFLPLVSLFEIINVALMRMMSPCHFENCPENGEATEDLLLSINILFV
jgi:hypothetical protein